MALDATTKLILNKFADSQPALQIPGQPAASASLQLGDLMEEALDGGTATDQTARDAADAAQADIDSHTDGSGIKHVSDEISHNSPMGSEYDISATDVFNVLIELDGAKISKAGLIPFEADQSMGSFKLVDLGPPSVGSDAATKDYADSIGTAISTQVSKWSKFSATAVQIDSFGSGVEHAYGSAEQEVAANATVMMAFVEVLTALVDSGTLANANTSTIKIGIDTLADDAILASTPLTAFASGYVACVLDGAVANFLKNGGANSNVTLTWTAGTGDATSIVSGEIKVNVEWLAL